VIVTLVGSDEGREYDRVSLDFAKDFRMTDPTAYALRAELVLNGARGESEFATRLKPRPFNPLFCASSFR